MKDLNEIEVLFFNAEKKHIQSVNKYVVDGYPFSDINKISYHVYERDFYFRTYKEVIVAGLFWTKKLFGATSIKEIFISHMDYGKKKQWFNAQLVHTANGVLIDGEKYNPFINIDFSYNTVTKVKFEIGFYRNACSNGCVNGFKELSKMEIKPEHLFDIPFWVNPCLITFLTKRFEQQIRILKNTSLIGEEIQNWIENNISTWNISEELIFKYVDELGENAYALLNALTDSASNFDQDSEKNAFKAEETLLPKENTSSNNERAIRQRRIGVFVEKLIEQIINENQPESSMIDINSSEFKINDDSINALDNLKIRENYQFDIGKIKF